MSHQNASMIAFQVTRILQRVTEVWNRIAETIKVILTSDRCITGGFDLATSDAQRDLSLIHLGNA
jgi:hypothetical protein